MDWVLELCLTFPLAFYLVFCTAAPSVGVLEWGEGNRIRSLRTEQGRRAGFCLQGCYAWVGVGVGVQMMRWGWRGRNGEGPGEQAGEGAHLLC